MKYTVRRVVALVLGAGILLSGSAPVFSRDSIALIMSTVQQTDSASSALQEGRRLLKRGKSDQALGQLQNALNLYTAANNRKGIAAAHNELGDLYLAPGPKQNRTRTLSAGLQRFDGCTR